MVAHDRSLGDRDHGVGAAGAVAALALPVDAVVGPPVRMVAERQQRCDVAIGDQPDVAAAAAVAAVRAALRHVRFATERDAARAAVTAFDVQVALVDEAGHPLRLGGRTRNLGKALQSGPAPRRKQSVGEARATSDAGSRRRARSDDGAVLVEFALVMPILVMLLLGMVTAGMAYNQKLAITNGVREGSRYGATLSGAVLVDSGPASGTLNCWLKQVADVTQSARTNVTRPLRPPADNICVVYVIPRGIPATDTRSQTRTSGANSFRDSSVPGSCSKPLRRPAGHERRVQVTEFGRAEIEFPRRVPDADVVEPGGHQVRGRAMKPATRDRRDYGSVIPVVRSVHGRARSSSLRW